MTQEYKGEAESYEQDVSYDNEDRITEDEVYEYEESGYSDNSKDFDTFNDLVDADLENIEDSEYSESPALESAEHYETVTGTAEDVMSGLDSIIKSFGTGTPDVSNIVLGAVTVASGASAMVMNMRKKIKNRALDCINLAEEEFINQSKSGKSKKLYAVQALTNSVPALLRPFVSPNFAEKAIDSSFNNMNKFAKLQNVKEDEVYETEDSAADNSEEYDDLGGEERFASIIDLIKNKGKSIDINSCESVDISNEELGEEIGSCYGKQEEAGVQTQSISSFEGKTPVVVNLFIEHPDGSLAKEYRKSADGETVNINIGYKCKYAGENNGFCKECVFNTL